MNADDERLEDLLLKRATGGLTEEERRELAALLGASHDMDDEAIDLAMAATLNAFAARGDAPAEAVPDRLKAKLLDDAERHFGEAPGGAQVSDLAARRARPSRSRNLSFAGGLGWAVAAALMIALVVGRPFDRASPVPVADFAAERGRLLSEAPETVTLDWSAPEEGEYARVRGDVVWNDARQQGYLRLSGMPANDPSRSQYQLWIVDPERDANPVDGGVFDIPEGEAEVVIPIDAKLAVDKPVLFAITREQPGGVVVSDGPLLVTAARG